MEYYKCQEDFFSELDQRFPDLPFYNMDIPDDPESPLPPTPPPPPQDGETSDASSLHIISRIGMLLAAMATVLYILQ